jgi:hypothetical protein
MIGVAMVYSLALVVQIAKEVVQIRWRWASGDGSRDLHILTRQVCEANP